MNFMHIHETQCSFPLYLVLQKLACFDALVIIHPSLTSLPASTRHGSISRNKGLKLNCVSMPKSLLNYTVVYPIKQ